MSSLSQSKSDLVRELFVSSKTPVQEQENMLAVFDFDHTIVDGNSDIVARDLISPANLIPNHKDYLNNWTQYMQKVFDTLKNINIPAEQVIEVVSLMCPNKGMPKLIRALFENNVDIIVASDSNSHFIDGWFKHNNLSDVVMCVYSNPSKIEDGVITIKPYSLQTTCDRCSKNMCKGTIMKEHILTTDKKYNKIMYFGDGKNDLCPVMKLSQNDYAFPRSGYNLDNLLKCYTTQAIVRPWCTGDDIYEYLLSLGLISVDSV